MMFQGQNNLLAFGPDLDGAKRAFCKKFEDKTRNEWADRKHFEKEHGKYDLVHVSMVVSKFFNFKKILESFFCPFKIKKNYREKKYLFLDNHACQLVLLIVLNFQSTFICDYSRIFVTICFVGHILAFFFWQKDAQIAVHWLRHSCHFGENELIGR